MRCRFFRAPGFRVEGFSIGASMITHTILGLLVIIHTIRIIIIIIIVQYTPKLYSNS